MIRHGEKLTVDEERKPLEKSGLNEEQQKKWRVALEALHLEEPEIAYGALPKIEKIAREMYDQLPDEAMVMFAPTQLPRTRMTAELLANEIMALNESGTKKISTSFIWEPPDVAKGQDSLSNIAMYPLEMARVIREFAQQDKADDAILKKYLEDSNPQDLGSRSYRDEDELIFKTANIDLASEHSILRERANVVKEMVLKIMEEFKDSPVPLYFYGVGHHQSLIALDIAFNGRSHYDSIDDMPEPLSLWKVKLDSQLD